MKLHTVGLLSLTMVFGSACQSIDDPKTAINKLVKDFGYIGWQNPLGQAETGTMVAGRPSAVSFIAAANECFDKESIKRNTDYSEYSRKYSYTFQGSFGFLLSGNPILSAGLGLNSKVYVNIELSGLTTEYMSSIDVTNWYQNGMSDVCKQYLNDVGFVIQALKVDKIKLSFYRKDGTNINLDLNNISQYVGFNAGVNWEIVDETSVVVTTPKYVGYQLGRLRLDDDGRSLWRAVSIKDDKYLFERISLFDEAQGEQEASDKMVKESLLTDKHAIYRK